MRVVVLGASGFLGRHVLPALAAAGHAVVAVSRRPAPASAQVEPFAADVLTDAWRHAPVHVDDVAAAIARSLENSDTIGRVLPLCGSRSLSYRAIVRELVERSGHRCFTPSIPAGLLRVVARLTSWMPAPPISAGQL